MRYLLNLFALLLFCHSVPAQVVFSTLPKKYQLFSRDASNYGHFRVAGRAPSAGTLQTLVSEMSSGKMIETFSLTVTPQDSFSIKHKIPACLTEYMLEVFITEISLPEQRVAFVPHLVAGDFYIVDGQSNAECPASNGIYEHDSAYRNSFTRVIGGNFSFMTRLSPDSTSEYGIDLDCMFALPSSLPYLSDSTGYAGVWPLRLQGELAKQTGIPNCFINGSKGGTPISEHFASHTPSLPGSLRHSGGPKNNPPPLLYDRMYQKLYANNAIAGVKGIFWYQGETDGAFTRDSAYNYSQKFKTLYTSWKADYPSLKKIFVLQINLGCGGDYHPVIREIQRRLPEEYPDVAVMSTIGSPLSDRLPDMCHYTVAGYSRIGTKLLPLVKKYIYDFPLPEKLILPANIQKAYYCSTEQICLEFDKNIVVQDSCSYPGLDNPVVYLKDYFYRLENTSIKVSSVTFNENKVFLNLASEEPLVSEITYLPRIFSAIPSLYSGPWIMNETNTELGAYAFSRFPVHPREQEEDLIIYPNPATQTLKIRFHAGEWHKLSLYDMYGKLVLTHESSAPETLLDVSSLATGIYVLSIKRSSGTITSKIVVE